MAEALVYAKVTRIIPNTNNTSVNVDVLGVGAVKTGEASYQLEYDHPGYSSIYTLLIALGINQKPFDMQVDDNGTIQFVQFIF